MTRVVVHIDRLVLTGFRREDRHAIAAGLQEELGRAFADPAAVSRLASLRDVPRLHVSSVPIDHGTKPQHVGESVARGIGAEIRK
jgi:hypothetical protein